MKITSNTGPILNVYETSVYCGGTGDGVGCNRGTSAGRVSKYSGTSRGDGVGWGDDTGHLYLDDKGWESTEAFLSESANRI